MEEDPRFAELSYQEQVQARTAWAMDNLPQDQGFRQLSVEEQNKVLHQVAYRPAIFEDKDLELSTNDLTERVRSGDRGATRRMSASLFLTSAQEENVIATLIRRAGRRIKERATGEDLPEDPDHYKQRDYFDYVLSSDRRTLGTAKFLRTFGKMVGFAGDLIAFNLVTAGTLTAPRGIAKLMMKGVGSIGKRVASKGALRFVKLAQGVSHAVAEGVSGVVRENVKTIIQQNQSDPNFGTIALNSLRHFGEYAAGDFLFFSFGSVLKNMGLSFAKAVTGKGVGKIKLRSNLTVDQVRGTFNQLAKTGAVDASTFSLYNPAAQANLNHASRLFKTLGRVNEMDRADRLIYAASTINYQVERQAGKLVVSAMDDPLKPLFRGSEDQVGNWLYKQMIDVGDLAKTDKALVGAAAEAQVRKVSEVEFEPDWVKYVGQRKGVEFGEVNKKIEASSGEVFENWTEAGKWLARKSVTDADFAQHLKDQGLKLVKKGDGLQVKKGTTVVAEGSSVEEVLESAPELMPKIVEDLGPEGTLIIGDQEGLRYVRNISTGSAKSIYKHLDKFKARTSNKVKLKSTSGKTLSLDQGNSFFEVYLPDIDGRFRVKSLNEAKRYMGKAADEWGMLTETALDKGYRLDFQDGNFMLYSDVGDPVMATTKAGLKKALRGVPVPEWAPELTGIDAQIANSLSPIAEFTKRPFEYAHQSDGGMMTKGWIASTFYSTPESLMVRAVEHGAPESVLNLYRKLHFSLGDAKANATPFHELADELFRINGRLPSLEVRKKIKFLVENADKWDDTVRKLELSPEQAEVARKFTAFLGESKEKGAFAFYGNEPDTFLTKYAPRLRKWIEEHPQALKADGEIADLFQEVGVPGQFLPWFKHSRVSDLAGLIYEEDPLALLHRYISAGHREMFVSPVLEEIAEKLKAGGEWTALSPEVHDNLLASIADTVGIPHGLAERDLKRLSQMLFEQMPTEFRPNKVAQKSLVDAVMGWGYGASMSFRPYLIARNLTQPYITTTPWVSLHFIREADNLISGKRSQDLMRSLRLKGVISPDLPVYRGTEATQGKVGKVIRKGLAGYHNADSLNRARSFMAAKLQFEDAADRSRRGIFKKPGQFQQMAGISRLDPSMQSQIMELVNKGNLEAAGDLYGKQIVGLTQFRYTAGWRPPKWKGTTGKLFGMFGTYPVQFVENIRAAMRYASFGEKMATATQLAAMMGALHVAAKSVGVRFNPWEAMTFSGGPYFHMAATAFKTMAPGYTGRQARAELLGVKERDGKPYMDWKSFSNSDLARWFVPSGFQIRSINRGFESLGKGDSYTAFLNFTGAPIIHGWTEP